MAIKKEVRGKKNSGMEEEAKKGAQEDEKKRKKKKRRKQRKGLRKRGHEKSKKEHAENLLGLMICQEQETNVETKNAQGGVTNSYRDSTKRKDGRSNGTESQEKKGQYWKN